MRFFNIEKTYPIALLIFGLIFSFLIPPMTTPDEPVHTENAYRLSNKMLHWSDLTSNGLLEIRYEDAGIFYGLGIEFDYDGYARLFQRQAEKIDDAKFFNANGQRIWFVLYPQGQTGDRGYLFAALGITVARLFRLSAGWLLFLATLFNFAFYLIFTMLAVRKMPVLKEAVFCFSLFPMVLQQTTSPSYDCPLLASAIMVFALSLKWFYGEKPEFLHKKVSWFGATYVTNIVTVSDLFLYGISAYLLFVIKHGAYAVLLLLPILMAISKEWFAGRKKWLWLAGAAFLIAWVCRPFYAYTAEQKLIFINDWFFPQEIATGKLTRPRIWYITHLSETCTILFRTLKRWLAEWLADMIGHGLGWLSLYLPKIIILLFGIVFVLLCFRKEGEPKLRRRDRIVLLVLGDIAAMIPVISMMFFWTPDTAGKIVGVQGRYFLPPLIFLSTGVLYGILPFKGLRKHMEKLPSRQILCGAAVLLCGATAVYLFTYFH